MDVVRVTIDSLSDDMLAQLLDLIDDDPHCPGISRDEPVVVEYHADLGKTVVSYSGVIEVDGDALSPLFKTSHTGVTASSPSGVPGHRTGSR